MGTPTPPLITSLLPAGCRRYQQVFGLIVTRSEARLRSLTSTPQSKETKDEVPRREARCCVQRRRDIVALLSPRLVLCLSFLSPHPPTALLCDPVGLPGYLGARRPSKTAHRRPIHLPTKHSHSPLITRERVRSRSATLTRTNECERVITDSTPSKGHTYARRQAGRQPPLQQPTDRQTTYSRPPASRRSTRIPLSLLLSRLATHPRPPQFYN